MNSGSAARNRFNENEEVEYPLAASPACGFLLTVGFLATARPEHRLMYLVAFGLRIGAAYLGALTARKMFHHA